MNQTKENIFTKMMSMDDAVWKRHAHPLSVWSRVITGLPVLLFSVWKVQTIGWLSLGYFALAFFWIWINPRLFSPPKNTNNWASKVTFGERVWLNRSELPIPKHHAIAANYLSIISGIAFLIAVIGAYYHTPSFVISGGLVSWLGKMWFCDRMVWLYEDMKHTNSEYASWLKEE